MYLHKNSILLRKLEHHDLPSLLALKQESWFGTHNIAIINSSDQERWFEKISTSHTDIYLIAVDYTTGMNVGIYKINNIDWVNHSQDIGLDVYKVHRNQGYGVKVLEAGVDFGFEILNINRINTEILESNVASQKLAAKGGFIREGIKRQCVYKCGNYLDSLLYSMLKEDWLKLERVQEYNGVCNQSYVI